MDITALVYYIAMGLALVGVDAYWSADSIISKVEVSPKYADRGLSADLATTLFSRELMVIFSNESIIRTPDIRAANDQSVISVIASSLKLDDLTYAFQEMFGLDPVQVKVALLADGDKESILITGASRTRAPFTLLIPRDEKLEMPEAIRHAALETASRLDPYHASLYLLEKRDIEVHTQQLKTLLQTTIDALPPIPDSPWRALYRNLQGIAALLEQDLARAAELFELAVRDTNNYAAAHLNLAFARIQQGNYEQGIQALRPILEGRAWPRNPAIEGAALTTRATAHWAVKNYAAAERDFAQAARINPIGTDMFVYWGLMLDEMGRPKEGAEKRRIGQQNLESFEQYPEVAMLYFWLEEKRTGRLVRRTQPHPSHAVAAVRHVAPAPTAASPSGALLKD